MQVNALQDIDGELEDRGSVTFGLFRESHSVSISAPVRLTGSNDIRRLKNLNISAYIVYH